MLKTLPASSHLGRRAQRVEDRPLLTGRGRFGDDAPVRAGTLHAALGPATAELDRLIQQFAFESAHMKLRELRIWSGR